MIVSSSSTSQSPRVAIQRDDAVRRRPLNHAATPARKKNIGAQKCVTHRVRNSASEVRSMFSGGNGTLVKKKRTWSSAIRSITIPRIQSMEITRKRGAIAGDED